MYSVNDREVNRQYVMSIEQIDLKNYEEVSVVGKGCYSVVTLQRDKRTGEFVALKTFTLVNEDERYEMDFMKEISILATSHHPCIIGFHGFSMEKDGDNMIFSYALDYMEKGCLDGILTDINMGIEYPDFGPTQRMIIILGIACAMRYLHFSAVKNGFVLHRDLKSGNVLLDDKYRPKLADFGFAKVIDDAGRPNTPKRGSWPWMAPEVMTSSNYGLEADVYSFGMLMYEIVTGMIPFTQYDRVADIYDAVVERKERPILPEPKLKIYDLITSCWDDDPEKRPNFMDLVPLLVTETFAIPGTDYNEYFEYAQSINAYDPFFE